MKLFKELDFNDPAIQEKIKRLIKDATLVRCGEVVGGHNMNDVYLNFKIKDFLNKDPDTIDVYNNEFEDFQN